MADLDRQLMNWATPRERESIEAMLKHGDAQTAADELGITRDALHSYISRARKKAARAGWSPDHEMNNPVPDGFHVRGVSTLYGPNGEVRGQWVKSAADKETQQQEQLLEALRGLAEPWKQLATDLVPLSDIPRSDDLLTVYALGDPHFGLHCWAAEAGEDFDLKAAEHYTTAGIDRLVLSAESSREALIISAGDMFHADSGNATTTKGTKVDVDTRWQKILQVGIRAIQRCIERSLEKHEQVTFISEIGNHDEHQAYLLALCLDNFYRKNPRVTIDTTPGRFHWYRFGQVLIGTHHGDRVKPADLPLVMANDRKVDWGETTHRHFYTGHIHHKTTQEFTGCTVESLRTLAAQDAWHRSEGYRSRREVKCDTWHRRWGLVGSNYVGIYEIDECSGMS